MYVIKKKKREPYVIAPARTNLTKHIIFEYANFQRKLKVASK